MLTNMTILDVETLSNCIILDRLMLIFAVTKERDNRDGNCNSVSLMQGLIFGTDRFYDIFEIAHGIVGLVWNHLEHPGTVLKH